MKLKKWNSHVNNWWKFKCEQCIEDKMWWYQKQLEKCIVRNAMGKLFWTSFFRIASTLLLPKPYAFSLLLIFQPMHRLKNKILPPSMPLSQVWDRANKQATFLNMWMFTRFHHFSWICLNRQIHYMMSFFLLLSKLLHNKEQTCPPLTLEFFGQAFTDFSFLFFFFSFFWCVFFLVSNHWVSQ